MRHDMPAAHANLYRAQRPRHSEPELDAAARKLSGCTLRRLAVSDMCASSVLASCSMRWPASKKATSIGRPSTSAGSKSA